MDQLTPATFASRRGILLTLVLTAAFWLSHSPPAVAGETTYEPKPGSAERKAIMDAMRKPVAKHVGKPILFTGNVTVHGSWAKFSGNVAPADGKPVTGDAAYDLSLDFFALLRRTKGEWRVLLWDFGGDTGAWDAARQKFPDAPKELIP